MFSRSNPLRLISAATAPKLPVAMGTIIGMLACSCAPVLAAQEYALTGQFNGATAPGGKLSEPTAMAVDESTGDIYVVERGSHIVAKLDAEGNYISELTGTPTGPGGAVKPFTEPSLITVENFPGSTRGDVYVLDEGPLREGTNGGRLPPVVDQFSSTGSYLSQITGVGKPEATGNSIPFGAIAGMAAGPGGALWLAERAEYYSVPSRGEPAILEFEEAGSSTEPWKLALKFPDGGSVGMGSRLIRATMFIWIMKVLSNDGKSRHPGVYQRSPKTLDSVFLQCYPVKRAILYSWSTLLRAMSLWTTTKGIHFATTS